MSQHLHQEPLVHEYTQLSQETAPEALAARAQVFETTPSRSWSEALRDLPRQYIKVFSTPSAATFAQEIPAARWDMVWLQLGMAVIIETMFLFLVGLVPSLHAFAHPSMIPFLDNPLSALLTIPLQFFAEMGLLYLLARAMGGKGSFVAQSYTSLLVCVPVNVLLSSLGLALSLIPVAGVALFVLLSLALSIYQIVLQVYALMAVHRLSGGKATSSILLVMLLFVLVGGLLSALVAHFH
jgi:Yip1 domain